ncbi:cupin domain-containing protein [Rhizosaccharibacter radicis]|uniref:Cupin domain-containing protein n=1 Tax=Rhizosaccharibacter radicis TaxID=2782605 RepID=A0ABT1VUQ3_9PROT|nr:cupin domain-containing protein [Acetobacteraceae bacterium KSS12]
MRTIAAAASLLCTALPAQADPFPPLQRRPVLEATLPASNPPVHVVRGASIRFAPGQPTGLHLHPASTVGVVTEGSFVFQPEGQPERIIRTGDVFFEPANQPILRFDNASGTALAAITVFYLTDTPDRPLIRLLGHR